jgi:2-polyprenyl-3-methyl-5-hydroxy-6-metoxy-1,4-benzoquinol methylase
VPYPILQRVEKLSHAQEAQVPGHAPIGELSASRDRCLERRQVQDYLDMDRRSAKGNGTRQARIREAFIEPDAPVARELRKRYATSHWDPLFGNPEALCRKIERSRYIANLLDTREKRVLDFGSGAGFLASYLATEGGASSVVGAEISRSEREVSNFLADEVFGATNLNFVENVDNFPSCSFDVIVLANVVTHIDPCIPVLVRLAELLTPGGLVFIEDNNNLQSFLVRRRLAKQWPKWDREFAAKRRARLDPRPDAARVADLTYGLTYEELDFWAEQPLEDLALLRRHAPLNPEVGIYDENAFRPHELAALLFNLGLAVRSVGPKHVFDFKRNRPVSWLFRTVPRMALYVAPAYEIIAVKLRGRGVALAVAEEG